MIHDLLENAGVYFPVSRRIADALKFLQSSDLLTLPLGKHVIDGDQCFAMVQEYMTKTPDKAFWEAHRKYIDVQYIVSGVEAMGWAPIQQMTVLQEYNPEKEYTVLQGSGQWVNLSPGAFVIFHPHDAHMGGIAIAQPAQVRKIVIKVAVQG
jgi:YhcH/YjgK/YiaL family protein